MTSRRSPDASVRWAVTSPGHGAGVDRAAHLAQSDDAAHGGNIDRAIGVFDYDVAAHGFGADGTACIANADVAAHGGHVGPVRGIGYVNIAAHLVNADLAGLRRSGGKHMRGRADSKGEKGAHSDCEE